MTDKQILRNLRGCELFSALSDSELEKVAASVLEKEYEPGITMFQERDSAKELFVLQKGKVRLVAKVGNGREVMPIAAQLKPDIVLLDFSLSGPSGLKVTNLIKRQLPQIPVVILLDEEDEKYILASLSAVLPFCIVNGQEIE